MREVGLHEARTHLSRLLRRVAAGEEVLICRGGVPVARLVPIPGPEQPELGRDRGLVRIAADFDRPLPDEWLRTFES